MRDRIRSNRRAHDGAKKYIDANGSKSRTVAMGREPLAVVIVQASDEPEIQPTHEHPFARQFNTAWRLNVLNENEVGAWILPSFGVDMLVALRLQCLMILVHGHGVSPAPNISRLSRYLLTKGKKRSLVPLSLGCEPRPARQKFQRRGREYSRLLLTNNARSIRASLVSFTIV